MLSGLGAGLFFTQQQNNQTITDVNRSQIQTLPAKITQPIVQTSRLSDVAENVVQSVVNISSEKLIQRKQASPFGPFQNDPFFRHFFGNPVPQQSPSLKQKEQSLGSGVIISDEGIILTNNHVIERAESIRISLADGQEADAEVLGADPDSDLAVLKLKTKLSHLKPLTLGDSGQLRLGEVVLAVGNPFGVGQTVTMGIVSAKGRANVGIVEYEDFIQTDAAINPGNSGGALVNLKGELIGINTAIISRSGGYQGIGFAIPTNMVKPIMESLIQKGKVVRGWLGIGIQDLSEDLQQAFSLQDQKGVIVTQVMEESPAKKGGLRQGDIILAVNGKPTTSTAKLRNLIANAGAGKKVTLKVKRNKQVKTLQVQLGEKPDPKVVAQKSKMPSSFGGLHVANSTKQLRKRFGVTDDQQGVFILQVESGSSAARAGFRPGDLIQTANGQKVTSIDQLKNAVKGKKKMIPVLIRRQGGVLYMVLPQLP